MMFPVAYQDLVGIPHARMDCWQVVRECYLRAGVSLPEHPSFENWERVSALASEWGDVLAISKKSDGNADSCGIVVDGGRILTSLHGHDVIIINERALNGKVIGRYRWKQ